jgi:phage tail-like protein
MDSNGLQFWMLSRLNDWLPPWRALTAYAIGQGIVDQNNFIQVVQSVKAAASSSSVPPVWQTTEFAATVEALITWINSGPGSWQANIRVSVGQCIRDPNGNLQSVASITKQGMTGATPPAWSTTTMQVTADGQVTWVSIQPRAWAPNQVYNVGQFVLDSNGNVQRVLVTRASVSAGTQPSWNSTIGQTTTDGQVTWINAGPGTWVANTPVSLAQNIPGQPIQIGQYIQDPNGNLQLAISGIDAAGSATIGTTGVLQPTWPRTLGETVADGTVTWSCAGPSQTVLFYCGTNNTLELRSVRTGGPPPENLNTATSMVNIPPMTLDQYGNYARWDSTGDIVMAGGSGPSDAPPPNEVPIYAPGQPNLTDLVMGYDGVLYLAVGGSLVMIDRRNRWPSYTLTVPDFKFWRLAALPEGGVLALDRTTPQLGKVAGQPLQTGPVDIPDPGILRPCQANPDPPQIVSRAALPAGETFVALAPMDMTQQPAQYVVMSWGADISGNPIANIRTFTDTTNSTTNGTTSQTTPFATPFQLGGVQWPYAIAWLSDQKFAVFATNLNEALIYDLESDLEGDIEGAGGTLLPAGDTYVLSAQNVGPIVHGFSLPPNYANVAGSTPLMLPLLPLSLNSLAPKGATNPAGPAIIDSGTSQCVWHRMFLEAIVPPRCGAVIWLTASDNIADLVDPASPWYPHILGVADTSFIPAAMRPGTPTAVWQSIPTEVAFAATLLHGEPVENVQGLWMVLVQRANKAVRNLSGRYLGVRIQLNGDGRNSPQIAGMRVYGPRFSYVQKYLPEIYHEAKFPPAADADGGSTRRDFFERFVDLFESQFTRIEDRIANAYLLMRPESTPPSSLDWLGSWVGIQPSNYPQHRRRARLEATPSLYQWRGTAKGVTEALDVATDGACSRGAIIVIEDFRLRHIFATILGADLSIQNNPLLPGYSGSSNSFVGDTLFLGDPHMQAELQALYQTDLDIPGSAQAVQTFYDQLAYRMTVFVHNQVENVNLKMVQRIVEAEKPAHVQAFVKVATQPFMIGLASLVGVNSYLGPDPPRNQVTVGVSDVGRYDIVEEMPSLDPRMNNSWEAADYAQPIARIVAPSAIRPGEPIALDGATSTSPEGTTISQYRWTLLNPPN